MKMPVAPDIRCQLIKASGEIYDITEFIGFPQVHGAAKECARVLTLDVLRSVFDELFPKFFVALGDTIRLWEVMDEGEDKEIFKGVVWERNVEDNNAELQITAYDKSIFLNKNEPSKQTFENKKPEEVTREICEEFGLETGELASGEKDTYNGRDMKAYEIIMMAYTQSSKKNNKKYKLIAEGDKIHVVESGKKHPIVLEEMEEPQVGKILKISYRESLDDAINVVEVVEEKKDDKKEKKEEKKESQDKYGVMKKIIKGEEADIKGALQDANMEITVECIADWDMITGISMQIKSLVVNGDFYIIDDDHEVNDGLHTATLKLASKFEMDEKEEGGSKSEDAATPGVEGASASASGAVGKMLAAGRTKMGNKYVWGAAGPNNFDCSGFVSWCGIQAGMMPAGSRITSGNMSPKYVHKVPWSDLRPGDILHFSGNPGHVAFYAGNGMTLECAGGNKRGSVKSLPLKGHGIYKNVYRFNKAG